MWAKNLENYKKKRSAVFQKICFYPGYSKRDSNEWNFIRQANKKGNSMYKSQICANPRR